MTELRLPGMTRGGGGPGGYLPAAGADRAPGPAGLPARVLTDAQLRSGAAEILEAVADRSALEQVFHDVKEVHGVGQAQTRNYWSNVAVYHLNLWLHTFIELWAWHRPAHELVDRQLNPWDDADRRPSHADKRNALRRQCLEDEFQAGAALGTVPRKIKSLWRRVVRLVA